MEKKWIESKLWVWYSFIIRQVPKRYCIPWSEETDQFNCWKSRAGTAGSRNSDSGCDTKVDCREEQPESYWNGLQFISDMYWIEKEEWQVEDIFEIILDLLEAIWETILPTKIKIWYKKQKRSMQVILEAIFDAIILILTLCCFGVVVCLIGLLFGLFGISFEG